MRKLLAIAIIFASISSAMLAQTARVYFDFNSDKLNSNYNNQIKALVSGNDQPIEIFAYTDTVGSAVYNLNLGKRRMKAVTNCIKQFNSKLEIKASNFGESKSSLPADSLNRRVDIFIKQKTKSTATIAPKETQEFAIDNSKDTTIIGNEGTKIFIPANSLVLANGQKPDNSIYKIQLQEYYKLSDMLMAKLSTTTNGQLLTTGGMLNLKITNNNQECSIDQQKEIGIAFKNNTAKDSMQLYTGSRKQNILEWNLSDQPTPAESEKIYIEGEEIIFAVEESATFRGGYINSFIDYIQSKLKSKQSNSTSIPAKVIVQFAINSKGQMVDVMVVNGVRPSIDYCVINAIKNSPEWKPARQGGKSVKQQFTIPIIVDLNSKIDSGINIDSIYNNTNLYTRNTYQDNFLNKNESATFRGGNVDTFKTYIQSTLENKIIDSTGNKAKVIVQFAINSKSEMEDVMIVKGIRPSIDYCVMNAIKNSPKWEPARKEKIPVKQRFIIPVFINLNSKIDSGVRNDSSLVSYNFERAFKDTNKNNTFLNSTNTGWLNCDRLLAIKDKTQFTVEYNMNMDAPCLIFKKFKSIFPAYFEEDNANAYLFNDVPLNEEVTVFSLKIVNNEYFLAYDSTNTRLKKIKLDFKKVDAAELKRVLDELDK